MPQVFGESDLTLISMASLWVEAASEREIERATHPAVAAEARARGLVPLRMGADPIWHHPETGEQTALSPAHSGESGRYSRIPNDLAELKRRWPTAEETARANRTPEQIEADSAAAAQATRANKQEKVEADRRRRQQQEAARFKQLGLGPFKSMDEVREAHGRRSPSAKPMSVDEFADALSRVPQQRREELHQSVFPERYRKNG